MEELKTCPFCGGKGSLQNHKFIGCADTYGVVCLDCGAETKQFYKNKEKAIKTWNYRAEKNQMTWSEEKDGIHQQR